MKDVLDLKRAWGVGLGRTPGRPFRGPGQEGSVPQEDQF